MKHGFRSAGFVLVLLVLGLGVAGEKSDGLSPEERQLVLDMMHIEAVLEVADEQLGRYPDSDGRLVKLESLIELRTEPFRERFQARDPWGAHYLYWSGSGDFVVISPGFNGQLEVDLEAIDRGFRGAELGDDLVISGDGWIRKPLSMEERQRITMADLRSLGTAIEEYSIDNNAYPDLRGSLDFIRDLSEHVTPMYMRRLPTEDGWGNPILGWSTPGDYMLYSTGSDGTPDRTYYIELLNSADWGGTTSSYASDLVFGNGSFIQWPKGRCD